MTCCDTKHPTSSTLGACSPGALPGGLRRTRFFDGMVLTQADLENEQTFWRVKRRLTNRALGEGVVWGLRLRWDPKRRVFALGPGYALDCCGNDLIVECPLEITEADVFSRADPALSAPSVDRFTRASAIQQPQSACLVLQYVECPEDTRPVHFDPCVPATNRCEPSRIRETSRLLLVPPPMADPPTCIDEVFAELEDLKASITDENLRNALFPPPPQQPQPQPGPNSLLPVTLRVATPGNGTLETTVQPPANGTVPVDTITGTRTPTGLRAGLVQFELRPVAGWGFTQGQVKDGDAVVDIVAPPVDLQQFWALEITLPDQQQSVTTSFAYTVDTLGLTEMFGARLAGTATLQIRGNITVSAAGNNQITTRVEGLTIAATSTVGEPGDTGSCFSTLVPWGIMEDPAHGTRDAELLLLAVLYAYFADVTNRSGGAWTQQRLIAMLLYAVAWRLLGVDVLVPNAVEQKQELARILARLFQCWCDAMVYPGLRCTSEHHGVYLGCATIVRGQIITFDMWEHRRHVLTGPLINHWLGVFGFAPIDVIAGRFAQAICCVAGLPLPELFTQGDVKGNGIAIGRGTLSVGGPALTNAREVGVPELVGRMLGAFVADGSAPLARFRSRLANGTVVDVVAPTAEPRSPGAVSSVDAAIDPLVRAAEPKLSPLTGSVVRRAAGGLAREIALTALPELTGPSAELAKQLAAHGMSLAGVLEAGPEGVLAAAPSADLASVEDLVTRADDALGVLVTGVAAAARKAKVGKPSATLRDPGLRKSLATDVAKRFGMTRTAVDRALDGAAAAAP